jgi:CheY-like chemotaxis protein
VLSALLIVDDEESIRMVTSRILEKHGYNLLLAASAEEALQLCRDHRPPIHLILTDLMMQNLRILENVSMPQMLGNPSR